MTFLERKTLCHRFGMNDDLFFAALDETGGWPLGFHHVSFHHTSQRDCIFTTNQLHNEMYTHLYTADDYFWWKISKNKKTEIFKRCCLSFIEKCKGQIYNGMLEE